MTWNNAGYVQENSWYKNKALTGGVSYTYQGGFFISSLGAANVNTFAVPVAGAIASGTLIVVTVGITNSGTSFTSVVFDPTGMNLTLTQDSVSTPAALAGVFSGVATSSIGSGTKNVVVTTSGGVQFQDAAVDIYTIAGNVSNSKIAAANGAINCIIAVTANDILIDCTVDNAGGDTWALSTQLPANIHTHTEVNAADWIISATNASFLVFPRSGGSGATAVANYH